MRAFIATTTETVRILLDTNILLRVVNPAGAEYVNVRSAGDGLIAGGYQLCFASQKLVEFWNVRTRPAEKNGFGLSCAETDARAKLIGC